MAVNLCFLLLSLWTLTIINPKFVSASLNMPSTQQQLNNIIDALTGAGDFGSWANVLSVIDPSTFPFTATLFTPSDNALSQLPISLPLDFDPLIFPYHIVPQQLSFSDLLTLKIGSRIPTLLPNKTIVVTNNTSSNYTIDDCRIIHPDLYSNGAISVQGIGSLFNYSAYGGDHGPFEDQLPSSSPDSEQSPKVFTPNKDPRLSYAPCLCTEFPIILSVVCAAFVFKIHRSPLMG